MLIFFKVRGGCCADVCGNFLQYTSVTDASRIPDLYLTLARCAIGFLVGDTETARYSQNELRLNDSDIHKKARQSYYQDDFFREKSGCIVTRRSIKESTKEAEISSWKK